ncbi:MAG: TetR family transcriptional regulator [Pseudomonadota bacterium]
MGKQTTTKKKLVEAARDLFWTRGYSNVSVRDIAGAAGADPALVSRYFGGKRALFEATLADIGPWDALSAKRDDLLHAAVASFSHPFDPQKDQANPFTMLVTNVIDPEIGNDIRDLVQTGLADPLAERLGGADAEDQAAMLLAVLFGVALMRKNFQLPALSGAASEDITAMTTCLAEAALRFGDASETA